MRGNRPGQGYQGFAVVDLETTGLSPRTDRIVEIAVVHLDPDGRVTGEFTTLINPCRDVGPTRIHGLKACDVAAAPAFHAAAAAVWRLLTGRVLAAHNASFDTRFLDAEFSRCGTRLPSPPVLCTMRLAPTYLPGLPARTLAACCQAAGVELSQQHSALADARAAARLLACYRSAHRHLPGSWQQMLAQAARTRWEPAPAPSQFRPLPRDGLGQRRP